MLIRTKVAINQNTLWEHRKVFSKILKRINPISINNSTKLFFFKIVLFSFELFLHHCAYAPLLMSIIKYYLFGEEFLTLGVDSHNELFTLVLKNIIIHCTNRFNQFCLGNWPIVSSKGSYKSAMMIYSSKHLLFHSICVNCTSKLCYFIWFLHQKFWLLRL